MAPRLLTPRDQVANLQSIADYLLTQWRSPREVLTVLLLLGPEVVQTAIAQLSGRTVTPVPFSFGWVTYSCSMLLSAIEGLAPHIPIYHHPKLVIQIEKLTFRRTGRQLMPNHQKPILVVNATNGHSRTTNSWVLCKLFDFVNDEVDRDMVSEEPHIYQQTGRTMEDKHAGQAKKKPWEALRVTVYKIDKDAKLKQGIPSLDWVWFLGFAVILIQLMLSILPWILNRDWAPFLVTLSGNCLAVCGASLPQWRKEKWANRTMGGSTVTLTRGNGTRTAIVMVADGNSGLDFEILAQNSRVAVPSHITRCATAILALFWILLLVTVAGLEQHTWYLFGVGLLGSIYTLEAAGAGRHPDCLGVHVKKDQEFSAKEVAEVLKKVQQTFDTTFIGASLLNIFFPGGLRAKGEDLSFWKEVLKSWFSPNQHGELVRVFGPEPNGVLSTCPRELEKGAQCITEVDSNGTMVRHSPHYI
ncbi:uncharacterized protein Z519_11054 [Cladophialophora bantiana CBS 173.52]|uniref:Uncharacterized protein n=1 Tax=Cladophialophora bantiana (strain ATCC 10958 / CBS 173.52 / CDC B-1940 / NIH 8579) TaxID=1442370 RepID=A0A0D2HC44_CLAB1|nr:uncharacterized protein Z519_11054 [Cladophialophora bantiana CBS 173.52]KIW88485.1 hypothetical protein Z519_11054 [Cladophialophora bantiana CBS 173.52]